MIDKETFEKLSPADRRVEIAKDVIGRLDSGRMRDSQLQFVNIEGFSLTEDSEDFIEEFDTNDSCSLKDFFEDSSRDCEVCAKGGLLVSWVANFNEYTLEDIVDLGGTDFSPSYEEHVPHGLLDTFPHKMMDFIEVLFEGRSDWCWIDDETMERYDNVHVDVRKKYVGNLRLIMSHIIENNGEIVDEKL